MSDWKRFHKTGEIEAQPWTGQELSDRVSISKEDRENGSPKVGDWIARDPDNPPDMWLISESYFNEHYEEVPY